MARLLLPVTQEIGIRISSSTLSTPTCAIPRAPPPDNASPMRGGAPGGWAWGVSAALHAKTFAVDGARIFVGSFNLDQLSTRINTEMRVVIEGRWFAQHLATARR